MHVIGKKGETVNVTFSRYDQTFLGLITDASLRISESAMDDLAGNYGKVQSQEFSENALVPEK